MANPEAEVFEPFWDAAALEDSVHELGLLYGIRNLTAVIRPGAETMCIRASDGIGIVLDPMQVVTGNGDHDDDSLEAMGHSYEITALFMIGHEIGHALDYLDPQWEMPTNETKGQGFFNTLVDDTVIDRRNRRVPLFDDYADSVYGQQLPHDILSMPKHVQLMYAIRMTEVETNPDLKMDAEVRAVIDGLRAYDKDGKVFDILHTMTDPRTELAQRKKIAQEYIWPYFEQLYEEDAQNQSQGEGEGENQDGQPGDFDDIYNDYMQAVHGHGDSDHQEGQEGEGSEGDQSEGQQGAEGQSDQKSLGEQLADALKELAEEQKAQAEARKEQAKQNQAASTQSAEATRQQEMTNLAGSVAKELQLSEGDAESYANSLDQWGPTIRQVADVFLQLAAPTYVIMSPRYDRSAHSEGVRLHPRTMAGVALQLETDQPQAVWQPVVRSAARQDVAFGGLDVHLVVDVSGSMASGGKAQCAADTALCLTEGLQLARYKVAQDSTQYQQPDVRVQITAFGSGAEVLSPLSLTPTGPQKGKTYVNLLNPNSDSTYVAGALQIVKNAATANPGRDSIVLIIGDGGFSDTDAAIATVNDMPDSVYVGHINIGGQPGTKITPHTEGVTSPTVLPSKLHDVLADYIKRGIV